MKNFGVINIQIIAMDCAIFECLKLIHKEAA